MRAWLGERSSDRRQPIERTVTRRYSFDHGGVNRKSRSPSCDGEGAQSLFVTDGLSDVVQRDARQEGQQFADDQRTRSYLRPRSIVREAATRRSSPIGDLRLAAVPLSSAAADHPQARQRHDQI